VHQTSPERKIFVSPKMEQATLEDGQLALKAKKVGNTS
jgi:hypothetical protein